MPHCRLWALASVKCVINTQLYMVHGKLTLKSSIATLFKGLMFEEFFMPLYHSVPIWSIIKLNIVGMGVASCQTHCTLYSMYNSKTTPLLDKYMYGFYRYMVRPCSKQHSNLSSWTNYLSKWSPRSLNKPTSH